MPADQLMDNIIYTLEEVETAIDQMIDEVMNEKLPEQYSLALGEVLASLKDAISLIRDSELKTN